MDDLPFWVHVALAISTTKWLEIPGIVVIMLGSVHEHNLIHNWGCHIIDLARIKPKMHWKHHICPIFCSEFRNNHGQPHNKSLNKIIYNTVPPGLLVVWKLLNRSGDG